MLLGTPFKKFIEASPVSVMVQGTLERIFDSAKVQQVFDDRAVLQYTKELTFDQCLGIMSDVVFQVVPSVGASYQKHGDEIDVTRPVVYDKLKHMELPISAGLVRYRCDELLPAAKAMGDSTAPVAGR